MVLLDAVDQRGPERVEREQVAPPDLLGEAVGQNAGPQREQPDAVIIATGSRPTLPPIPGADLPFVATTWQVLQSEKNALPGEYVLLYDTIGFHQATSVAELLAERGCAVEIVTGQFYVGGDLNITLDLELWYRRALAKGIKMTANHFLASLGPNSATIINNYTGQPRQIEHIALAIMATPQIANDDLYLQLQGKVKELYRAGDCIAPAQTITSAAALASWIAPSW